MTPKTTDSTTPNISDDPEPEAMARVSTEGDETGPCASNEPATPFRSPHAGMPHAVRDRVGRIWRYTFTGGHQYVEDKRRRRPEVLRLTEQEAAELRSTGRVYVRLVAGYYDAVDSAELAAIDRGRR